MANAAPSEAEIAAMGAHEAFAALSSWKHDASVVSQLCMHICDAMLPEACVLSAEEGRILVDVLVLHAQGPAVIVRAIATVITYTLSKLNMMLPLDTMPAVYSAICTILQTHARSSGVCHVTCAVILALLRVPGVPEQPCATSVLPHLVHVWPLHEEVLLPVISPIIQQMAATSGPAILAAGVVEAAVASLEPQRIPNVQIIADAANLLHSLYLANTQDVAVRAIAAGMVVRAGSAITQMLLVHVDEVDPTVTIDDSHPLMLPIKRCWSLVKTAPIAFVYTADAVAVLHPAARLTLRYVTAAAQQHSLFVCLHACDTLRGIYQRSAAGFLDESGIITFRNCILDRIGADGSISLDESTCMTINIACAALRNRASAVERYATLSGHDFIPAIVRTWQWVAAAPVPLTPAAKDEWTDRMVLLLSGISELIRACCNPQPPHGIAGNLAARRDLIAAGVATALPTLIGRIVSSQSLLGVVKNFLEIVLLMYGSGDTESVEFCRQFREAGGISTLLACARVRIEPSASEGWDICINYACMDLKRIASTAADAEVLWREGAMPDLVRLVKQGLVIMPSWVGLSHAVAIAYTTCVVIAFMLSHTPTFTDLERITESFADSLVQMITTHDGEPRYGLALLPLIRQLATHVPSKEVLLRAGLATAISSALQRWKGDPSIVRMGCEIVVLCGQLARQELEKATFAPSDMIRELRLGGFREVACHVLATSNDTAAVMAAMVAVIQTGGLSEERRQVLRTLTKLQARGMALARAVGDDQAIAWCSIVQCAAVFCGASCFSGRDARANSIRAITLLSAMQNLGATSHVDIAMHALLHVARISGIGEEAAMMGARSVHDAFGVEVYRSIIRSHINTDGVCTPLGAEVIGGACVALTWMTRRIHSAAILRRLLRGDLVSLLIGVLTHAATAPNRSLSPSDVRSDENSLCFLLVSVSNLMQQLLELSAFLEASDTRESVPQVIPSAKVHGFVSSLVRALSVRMRGMHLADLCVAVATAMSWQASHSSPASAAVMAAEAGLMPALAACFRPFTVQDSQLYFACTQTLAGIDMSTPVVREAVLNAGIAAKLCSALALGHHHLALLRPTPNMLLVSFIATIGTCAQFLCDVMRYDDAAVCVRSASETAGVEQQLAKLISVLNRCVTDTPGDPIDTARAIMAVVNLQSLLEAPSSGGGMMFSFREF